MLDLRVVDRISSHFYSKELESSNRDLEMVFDVTWHSKSRFWAEVEFGKQNYDNALNQINEEY